MREIKFRAWDKDNKEMFEPAIQLNDSVYKMIIVDVQEDKTHFAKIENAEIMQYTGLKDKNGKEIYEGDICTNEYGLDDYYYVVEWVYSGFQLVTYKNPHSTVRGISNGMNQGYMEDELGIEIIGNIHENPELLKGE